MAARKAIGSPPLRQVLSVDVKQGLALATEIFSRMDGCSPSLDILIQIWEETEQPLSIDMDTHET